MITLTKDRVLPAIFVLLAVVAAAYSVFIIQTPSSWPGPDAWFRWPLAMILVAAVLQVGSAILILKGVQRYKSRLRTAFAFIAIAMVLVAIATVQTTVVSGYALWEMPWVKYGGLSYPYLISAIILYGGTRSFAQLVDVRGRLTLYRVVLPVVTIACIISTMLPHAASPLPEPVFDFLSIINLWTALLNLIAGSVLWRVAGSIGGFYARAIAWLALGITIGGIVTSIVWVSPFFVADLQNPIGIVVNALGAVAGICMLTAGSLFTKLEKI
ncbi:MAG TPA: hypothetical protein VLA88_05955 [Candidatus Saccharimonadales bacterium]|nr:hypothetical protein [Candidatus Saccharimonadales bacterium]